ncbi:hypothetical protein [Nocardiopsis synnemataformans]|uniref:hypothetical protein n=1 Tax=Nocardiopsis synnemataformans TaxID=61305 RepID=UPI003EBFD2BC
MTVPTRGLVGAELSIAKAAQRLMGLRENTVNPPKGALVLRLADAQDTLRAGLALGAEVTATLTGRVVDAYEVGGLHHYVIQTPDGKRIVLAPLEDGSTITRT